MTTLTSDSEGVPAYIYHGQPMPAQDEAKAIEVELNWRYQHGDQTRTERISGLACDGILPPAAVSTQVYNGRQAVEVGRLGRSRSQRFSQRLGRPHRSGLLANRAG